MPLVLREKSFGPIWVAPVIDEGAGPLRVTLILQVGTRQTTVVAPVNAQDLDVQLIDAEGRTLELLERPVAGELPIRGGPSRQSTAEFQFAPSGHALRRLHVRVGQETQTFEITERRLGLRGFPDQPSAGDNFPIPPPPRNVLEKILRAILDFFISIGKFFKRLFDHDECCVTRFVAPENSAPGFKSEYFEMNAEFSDVDDCDCECCEYRQFVRGFFRDAAGGNIPFLLPGGPLDPNEYLEDGVIDEFGPGVHGFYGHREAAAVPGDQYLPDQEDGCEYQGNDTPGCGPTETLHAEFLGLVVDTCKGEIREVRAWVIDL